MKTLEDLYADHFKVYGYGGQSRVSFMAGAAAMAELFAAGQGLKVIAEPPPCKHGHWVSRDNEPFKCKFCGVLRSSVPRD